jgi:hypothetical protein
MAARGQSGCDTRLCLVARHVDVNVDAVALRPWRVHLLEREGRPAATRVEHVLAADRPIAEHRAPVLDAGRLIELLASANCGCW